MLEAKKNEEEDLDDALLGSIALATQAVQFVDNTMGDTQDTDQGSTPTTDFHVGPDVELLSQTEVDATLNDLFREDADVMAAVVMDAPSPIINGDDEAQDEEVALEHGIFDVPDHVAVPRVRCTLCVFSCTVSAGLVRHVLAKHEGARLNAANCSCFVGLGKGLCLSCGTLRAANGNFCGRCRTSVGTRPPIAGDLVRAPKNDRGSMPAESISDEPVRWIPSLPENLVERLQRIPCNTIVHVPVAFRDRLSRILTRCNMSMVAGDADGNLCARAWPKLLFSVPPGGFNLQNELSKRFALWRDGDLLQLLCRIEEQCRLKSHSKSLKWSVKSQGGARRARIFIQEGVLSKAAKTLTGDVAALSEEEQLAWARKLLPNSASLLGALFSGDSGEEEDQVGERTFCMQGIRFTALSAPGPSGARPEHFKEALANPRRQVRSALSKSIDDVVNMAMRGDLPDVARWILDSRLVYLKKKASNTPRPVRIGEVFRRIIGKRLKNDLSSDVSKTFLEHRQFGVGVPGGVDILVAFRMTIESSLRRSGRAFAILDLDLENFFPNVEWSAIRENCARLFPKLSKWLQWKHRATSSINLPSGGRHSADRGAEQGDPLGGIEAAAALVGALDGAKAELDALNILLFDV